MSRVAFVPWLAERLIRRACRRLPEHARDDRYREWTAELAAILDDAAGGFPGAARGLRYATGIARAVRRMRPAAPAGQVPPVRPMPPMPWRTGAPPARPAGPAARAVAGLAIWLVLTFAFIAVVREFPPHSFWQVLAWLAAPAGFAALCLADLARRAQVRYLPKWGWALACLLSIPLGGILYLSIGRVPGGKRRAPGRSR